MERELEMECVFVGGLCIHCGRSFRHGWPVDVHVPCRNNPRSEMGATPDNRGVGTELSKLLAKFGIKANEGCKCKARALEMDHRGIEWCEKNIELIVDWLEEESTKRHLPFVRAAGKILIRRAIRNAKRQNKESLNPKTTPFVS